MVAPREADVVEREVRIAARPETVFAFFTDAAKMLRWMGIAAELDPRPGGIYRVRVTEQYVARGHYVEVVPDARVVFTWGWEGEGSLVPPGSTTVEVALIADGDDTVVRLRHLGLPVEQREEHRQGWEHYLARLAIAASGGDAGPDPWASPLPGGAMER